MRRSSLAAMLVLVCPILTLAWGESWTCRADEPTRTLVVRSGDQALGETPIVIEVEPSQIPPGRYQLVEVNGPSRIPALAYRDADRVQLGFVLPSVSAGATTRFLVTPDPAPADPGQGVTLVSHDPRVDVRLDGKPWTTYVPDDGPKPYFDPLVGPSNVNLTRSWPMREVAGEPHDHPHHRSMWLAHIDVNKTNTWDENPGHGSIRETTRPTTIGGGPIGVLRTTDDWLNRTGAKVCTDERIVRFYATRMARVFDFEVVLQASTGPLKIGDNKDGVFGVRVAAPLALTAKQGGKIVTARGLTDKAAWGQAAEWVDYTGPIGGETMGIAILNHPSSFRYPTTWHVRDYGLFAANPFGWHDFGQAGSGDHVIEPGASIRLAYRVILHQGNTESAGIAAQFQSYAHPPQVKVE